MQEYDFQSECADFSGSARGPRDKVAVWDMAAEFHVGRNTVANIAKKLSIQLKYEDLPGRIRAYVYNDEADKIRQVLADRYIGH